MMDIQTLYQIFTEKIFSINARLNDIESKIGGVKSMKFAKIDERIKNLEDRIFREKIDMSEGADRFCRDEVRSELKPCPFGTGGVVKEQSDFIQIADEVSAEWLSSIRNPLGLSVRIKLALIKVHNLAVEKAASYCDRYPFLADLELPCGCIPSSEYAKVIRKLRKD